MIFSKFKVPLAHCFQFICFFRVAGVPVPEVKWFRDGEELKPDEHVRIESLPDGTNYLVIDSVSVEDQGNYRCEATNNAGSMSSKAPLTVNGEVFLIDSVLQFFTNDTNMRMLTLFSRIKIKIS